ncbi:hypothetical protein AMK26_25605 [Streptomyces sp. CB03234]|uniref:DUF461 domain-containing protein n=1 Tax=Streptomyces sp. (strain CB03234) TaxID=1703937 RepID=UPI00093BD3F6|nr:DUF461 domain-containing protein [Streptomyces sp. CB03234]OKJ99425.1 hypothetical protein AMK26_25605 [Streptomyces sp. CB03234]
MSRSLRRGVLAATAIVFSIASLSACGAGNNAQTLGVRPDHAATSVGTVKIQNAMVITQPKPDAEGPAVVSAMLFNNGSKAETLEAIELPGTDAQVKLTAAGGSGQITVPAGGSVLIGGQGNASAVIEKGREAARNGDAQEVVFKLSETGDVGLEAFVIPATSYFAGYGPTEVPQKPAEQSPASTPPAPPSGAPTGSPTGSPAAPDAPNEGDQAPEAPSDSASASHDAGH